MTVLKDEGLGDVLGEVAAGGGGVTGEGEARQGRQGQVEDQADARLQHAAAPDRYPVRVGDVVDAARLQVAADPGGLHVDHPAGVHGDRGGGVAGAVQGLVEQAGVAMRRWSRACAWRLFSSSGSSMSSSPNASSRRRCSASASEYAVLASTWSGRASEALAHGPYGLQVPAGFDLQLDPDVPSAR